jgi:hypothetical protein
LRAERLRACACCQREEESGEAIWRTAKNPTPTGRPQRRGKDDDGEAMALLDPAEVR